MFTVGSRRHVLCLSPGAGFKVELRGRRTQKAEKFNIELFGVFGPRRKVQYFNSSFQIEISKLKNSNAIFFKWKCPTENTPMELTHGLSGEKEPTERSEKFKVEFFALRPPAGRKVQS